MRDERPQISLEVRYAAPPSFVGVWLTDYRSDDAERFFHFGPAWKVGRTPGGFRLEGRVPWIGRDVTTVTILDPGHWTAEAELFDRRDRTLFRNHIDERLVPDGGGTLQHVRIWIRPQTLRARFMAFFMVGVMRRRFRRGFDRMRALVDAEFADAPPARAPAVGVPPETGR